MCLIVNHSITKYFIENSPNKLTVYKFLKLTEDKKLLAPYYQLEYKVGENTADIPKYIFEKYILCQEFYSSYQIDEGLHVYLTLEEVNKQALYYYNVHKVWLGQEKQKTVIVSFEANRTNLLGVDINQVHAVFTKLTLIEDGLKGMKYVPNSIS